MKKYNIIIADDHKMFLDGLISILEKEKRFSIILTAKSGKNVIKYLTINGASDIDMVITDISMPDMTGIELNTAIKELYPEIKILVVSMHEDTNMINQLMKDGVDGFVPKNAEKKELLNAIKTIFNGSPFFSESIKRAYFDRVFEDKKKQEIKLTDREKEVLILIAEEYTTYEIAEKLSLSKYTIESYRKTLFSKLNVKNIAGLVKRAMRLGFIE